MGAGTGVALLLAGAVLYWAVEVDLAFVDEGAVGVILMICGAIATAASLMMRTQRTQSGVSGGIVLFAVGAALAWAVELSVPYVLEDALGVILMIGGLVAVIASVVMHVQSLPEGTRPLERLSSRREGPVSRRY